MTKVIDKVPATATIEDIENGVQITIPVPFKLTKSDIKGKSTLKKDILSIALGLGAIGVIAVASLFIYLGVWVVIVGFLTSAIVLGFSKRISADADEEKERDKQISINRISRELLGPWLHSQGFKKSEHLAVRILTNGEASIPSNNAWKVENIRLKFVNGKPIILAYDWS
jgi:hypothetical protein